MAVYTDISESELTAFLAPYGLGKLIAFEGIAEGVENSNYQVTTARGKFILTIFEKRVDPDDLPFFFGLMEHLSAQGFPCPQPLHPEGGGMIGTLRGKPAGIVTFLQGKSSRSIRNEHCAALGEAMAQMHRATANYSGRRANALDKDGWEALFLGIQDRMNTIRHGLAVECGKELTWLKDHWPKSLPSGVIHADLFPDNVFFDGATLTGIIDFYFACNDFYVYELAIVLNAWCFEPGAEFNITKAKHLLTAYNKVRQFSDAELTALPIMARGAALRFLLTRAHDWLHHDPQALVTPKNPMEYLKKLHFHQHVQGAGEYGL